MKYLLFVMRVSNAIVKIAEASLYKKSQSQISVVKLKQSTQSRPVVSKRRPEQQGFQSLTKDRV